MMWYIQVSGKMIYLMDKENIKFWVIFILKDFLNKDNLINKEKF